MSGGAGGRTRVKICGITRVEDGRAAAACGADAIGLVFYPPSPRAVDVETAAAIRSALPPFVTAVGLFVNAEPGAILVGEQREFCRSWPNQQEVTVKGSHFIQEDSPDEIGQALRSWLTGLVSA